MKHLDLFSGIGGFALAARWVGWETVGFCEIDPYCQKVLAKNFPDVPINGDIRDIDLHNPLSYCEGEIDVITAGFPCQPYSVAGKQRGASDDRDLWPETMRFVRAVRPTWLIAENVTGFISMGLDKALSDLAKAGYYWLPLLLPACALNATHKRSRLFIIAHSERDKQPRQKSCSREVGRVGRVIESVSWDRSWEDAVAHARRMDDGISGRVVTDRTDAIRNAIVPQVAEVIFRAINSVENRELPK